jgi:hypothetical protein
MKPVNFDRTFKKLVHRTPFRPFQVELVSGSKISVPHPEALAYHNGTGVFFDPQGGVMIFDAEEVSSAIYPPKDATKQS